MEQTVQSLGSFTIGATDGEIGSVEQFYFDDETWTIRYLVVKTGGWLSGRKVLISPAALKQPDWENKIFPVNLSTEQIKNSPDVNTEQTVSRQQEIGLYDHYSWPYHATTGSGFYGGMGLSGLGDSNIPFEDAIAAQHFNDQPLDSHLRATNAIIGYQIHASDGSIGKVEDFIIDEQTWTISYLIVETGAWFHDKKVILSPKWIEEVKWEDSSLTMDISIDQIKRSAEYDPTVPLPQTHDYDHKSHYRRL